MSERDGQIASLTQTLAERNAALASVYASTSWRLTAPYRWVGHQAKRLRHLWRITPQIAAHSGGLWSACVQAMRAYRSEGLVGVKHWLKQVQAPSQPVDDVSSRTVGNNDSAHLCGGLVGQGVTHPVTLPTDRIDKALFAVNRVGKGLEIGPAFRPLVPKSKGFDVETLDHASADELRKEYTGHGVDINHIEDVDYIWQREPLDLLTGKRDYYDFIIASHVVEHTPDLISFLTQCEAMLKPDGVLSLVVPDRRYCFDRFRRSSTTGDILQAYFEKRTRHTIGTIFDHFSMAVKLNGMIAWHPGALGKHELVHSFVDTKEVTERASSSDEYFDVHNWRFTPASFRLILHDLSALGYISLGEACLFPTEGCEFFISLKRMVPHIVPLDRLDVDRLELLQTAAAEHSAF